MPTAPTPVPYFPTTTPSPTTTIARAVGAGGGGGNGGKINDSNLNAAIWVRVNDILSGAWWITLHFLLPLGFVGFVASVVFAAFSKDSRRLARARLGVFVFPLALFLIVTAQLVANWFIAKYGPPS